MIGWNFQGPQFSTSTNDMTGRAKALAGSFAQQMAMIGAAPTQAPHSRNPAVLGEAPTLTAGISGFGSNVPLSLINTESGGNWNAQNSEMGAGNTRGHHGIMQFGQARLTDAIRAGAIPQMTPEQFRANPGAQVAATNWHFNDIDQNIRRKGLDRYVGQTIGGVNITMDALRAMAHLGGFGGAQKFVMSGGQYNPADSFGTTLSKYGRLHG